MYSYRACCQIAQIARPPSLLISWRSARSFLMCNDSLIFLTPLSARSQWTPHGPTQFSWPDLITCSAIADPFAFFFSTCLFVLLQTLVKVHLFGLKRSFVCPFVNRCLFVRQRDYGFSYISVIQNVCTNSQFRATRFPRLRIHLHKYYCNKTFPTVNSMQRHNLYSHTVS